MKDDEIFQYSNIFLNEIIEEIISLKAKNVSNPKNTDFENKLKSIFVQKFEKTNFRIFCL